VPAQPLTDSIWLQPYPDAQLGVEASMLGPDARYERDFGALNLISISPNGRRRFTVPRPGPAHASTDPAAE
jgi:hypothetical protein